jgi:hypothetical protein
VGRRERRVWPARRTSDCREGPLGFGVASDGRTIVVVRVRHPYLIFVLALGGAVLIGLGRPPFQVLVAMVVIYGLLRLGVLLIGGLAQPVPEPPPAGELRKVKIQYRCTICGAEVRMTVAPNEEPQPPRHCQEDMDLVAPVE